MGLAAFREFQDDHIPLIAGGIAFYALLAFFPGLAAFVALYGLVADIGDAREQIRSLAGIVPADVLGFLGDQMMRAAAARPEGLSLALAGGLLISIWSANGAVSALMLGMNIAYEESEKRSWLKRTLVSLAFTAGAVVFAVALLALSIGAPLVYDLGGENAAQGFLVLRVGGLILAVVIGVSLIYRYGPSRHRSKWRLLGPGPVLVAAAWLAATLALSVWLSLMARYADKYGPVGAVLAFMMWAYLSAIILLAGAELDAETSAQAG